MLRRIWGYGIILLLVMTGLCLVWKKDTNAGVREDALEKKLAGSLKEQESLIDYAADGTRIYAIISSLGNQEYGDCLMVFRERDDGGYEREYSNDFTGLKPWKLELADVDGDGVMDLLTGVRKTTHYDQEEKNRFFVFDYTEGKLVKKWTGSQIAGTWNDFYVKDFLPVKGEEVLFVSQTEGNRERLGIYYWFNFGFLLLAQSEEYETIEGIRFTEEDQLQMNCSKDKEEWIDLTVKNGKIIRK